jgi:hypothetical protein
VKLRLLLTSALFLFVQTLTTQAQETLDLAKITCQQFAGEQLAAPSRDITLVLAGYYNGKRNNTIIEPKKSKKQIKTLTHIAFNTAKRPSWMPSRTCLALTNELRKP